MFLDSRKRKNSNTTLEERKWLINHAEKNTKLSSTKLALDGNEDVKYFDLVEVPDSEIVSENDLENVSENYFIFQC